MSELMVIDLTPKARIFYGMRNQDMPLWAAVSELIDNSFDAKATRVDVLVDSQAKTITVKDNGKGAEDPRRIVRIGDSDEESNRSGRYGIGAKDAILTLGSAVHVTTTRNDLTFDVYADFAQMEATDSYSGYMSQRKARKNETGTTVKVSGLRKLIYGENITKNLAKIFTPALRRGGSISWAGWALTPDPEPEVMDRIEGQGEFNGKMYSYWAGILPSSDMSNGGWHYEFYHRRLEATSSNRSYGTKGFPIDRFYGVITLLEPIMEKIPEELKWKVNKHKTSCEELQDLCEHIFPEIEALLQKAESEYSLTLEADLADEVGQGLTDALGDLEVAKEKRTKLDEGDGEGVEPRNTGRRRRQAIKIQAGNGSIVMRAPSFSGKKFNIRFTDESVFGRVTGDRRSNVVYFGKNHPYWAANIQDRNVVYLAAMAMLAGHAATTTDENQPIISAVVPHEASNERFFQTFGNIAAQVAQKDALAVNA